MLALSLFHYLDWTTQRDDRNYGREGRGRRAAKGPEVGIEPRTAEESGELNEQQYPAIPAVHKESEFNRRSLGKNITGKAKCLLKAPVVGTHASCCKKTSTTTSNNVF